MRPDFKYAIFGQLNYADFALAKQNLNQIQLINSLILCELCTPTFEISQF